MSQQQHFEAVQSALQKLPKVHLSVIDVIIHHFKECVKFPVGIRIFAFLTNGMPAFFCRLIDKTKSDESNEVYLAKLALAIGRGSCWRTTSSTLMMLIILLHRHHKAQA